MKRAKDGHYYTSVSYKGQKQTVYANTQTELIRKAERARMAMERGERLESRMTVKDYTELYKSTYLSGRSQHEATMLGIADNAIIPNLGKRRLYDVTPTILTGFINSLEYGYWHTVKVVQLVKAIFRQANEDRLIPFDPAKGLKVPKGLEKGSHRQITGEEREMVLRTAAHHPAGLFCRIILGTGLRPGEVAALRWSDFDLSTQTVHVRRALKRDDSIGPPKSPSSIRDVPIPTPLCALLRDRKPEYESDVEAPLVVEKLAGGTLDHRGLESLWRSFKRQMDIDHGAKLYRNKVVESVVAKDLTAYCLRHTYCTDLEAAGVPITVAAYLMGHSEISTTAKYYTHTNTNTRALNDAKDAINGLHAPQKKEQTKNNVVSIFDFTPKNAQN